MVERETCRLLKCLRADNEGDYTSKIFDGYCAEHGIRHKKIVPGTLQHNGLVEILNCTIIERVRSILRMSRLHKAFWVEVILTTCYFINRSPLVSLDGDTPERA